MSIVAQLSGRLLSWFVRMAIGLGLLLVTGAIGIGVIAPSLIARSGPAATVSVSGNCGRQFDQRQCDATWTENGERFEGRITGYGLEDGETVDARLLSDSAIIPRSDTQLILWGLAAIACLFAASRVLRWHRRRRRSGDGGGDSGSCGGDSGCGSDGGGGCGGGGD